MYVVLKRRAALEQDNQVFLRVTDFNFRTGKLRQADLGYLPWVKQVAHHWRPKPGGGDSQTIHWLELSSSCTLYQYSLKMDTLAMKTGVKAYNWRSWKFLYSGVKK